MKKARQIKNQEPRFDYIETEKGSGGWRQSSTKMCVSSSCDHEPPCYWASANIPPAKECQAAVVLMGQFRIFTATKAAPP